MSNSYYNHGGNPGTGSPGASATMRAEFDAVAAGFALLPALGSQAGSAVIVNGGSTALMLTGGALAIATGKTLTANSTLTLAGTDGKTLTISNSLTFAGVDGNTLTFPSGNDTVVTLTAAQTLTNKTLTAPVLGAATATSVNKVAITAPATSATLTIADGKTLTASNSLTLAGTDGNTLTFPSGNDTVVTLTASQTLTNKTLTAPVLGAATATSINKITLTQPATGATLTLVDGKTLTVNNSLTLAGTDGKTVTHNASTTFAGTDGKTLTIINSLTLGGTDGTTMTFPATSATLARTDAGQTFTGAQTFAGGVVIESGNTTLNDYSTGTWTPTDASGASLSLTVNAATYTKIGRLVFITGDITYPSTANGAAAVIGGLPFTTTARADFPIWQASGVAILGRPGSGATVFPLENAVTGAVVLNSTISTQQLIFSGCYNAT